MENRVRRPWSCVACLLLVIVALSLVPRNASAQYANERRRAEFWIGAVDPVVQRDRKISNPSDYMELFQPPAAWPFVARRTSTLEISTQLVLRGTPAEHKALIEGVRRNNLKVAGQFGVEESSSDPSCGGQMEGRGGPANAEGVAKRTHDLGIPLDYLDMDEPVTWGRMAPRNKCPESVEKLAQTAASKVASYRKEFPAIKINLIDAVGGPFKTAVHDEVEFIDLLGKAGVHIDYFIADMQWGSNWRPSFEELATKLHARGIKVGMYCDGLLTSNSDLVWERDAVNNCKAVGNDPKIAPDLYMIGTWSPYPTKIFPEDKPGTLTHIGKELMTLLP
jgi:hypothetical protein